MKARWVSHNPSPKMPIVAQTLVAKWWPGRYYLVTTMKADSSSPLHRLTQAIEQGVSVSDVVPGPNRFVTMVSRCNRDMAVRSHDDLHYDTEYSEISAARDGHRNIVGLLQNGLTL
jgi:hypothetical protein